jgi:hypothetical protein
MTNSINVAANINFQAIALTEALNVIAKDTGIAFESLIAQLPTNEKLMKRAAEMVARAAKVAADSINSRA